MSASVTIAGSAAVGVVTLPLPSYRALIEYSKQCDASQELIEALATANLLEPLLLDSQATSELVRIIDVWLTGLPFAAWPAGLFELRNHLGRQD